MIGVRDVAKLAKVSAITVSRTINNPDMVSDSTKEKVYAAMKELNYSMNPVAKGFSSNRSQVICVYVPSHIEYRSLYVMELILGISEVCSHNLYSFLIIQDFDLDVYCDGYILSGVNDDEIKYIVEKAKDLNRKVVLFGTSNIEVSQIDVDNYYGANLMMNEISKVENEIVMLSIKEEKGSYFLNERERAYVDTVSNSNIVYVDNNLESAYNLLLSITKESVKQAYFCATDIIALALIKALQANNIKIDNEIFIGGFDGFGYEKMSIPTISTIKQPIYEIGKRLAEVLINSIKESDELVFEVIKPTLLLNDSLKKVVSK